MQYLGSIYFADVSEKPKMTTRMHLVLGTCVIVEECLDSPGSGHFCGD